MRIFVDVTEPGILFHDLTRRAGHASIAVERTILHKRDGLAGSARDTHPLYGIGADFVITDDARLPLAAVERKTLDDLAKSASIVDRRANEGTKMFRQLHELLAHPMPILLLEGAPSLLYRRMEPVIVGLQLWCAREGIAILYTTGPLASAHAVVLLARKLGREAHSLAVEEYVNSVRLESLRARSQPSSGQPARDPQPSPPRTEG